VRGIVTMLALAGVYLAVAKAGLAVFLLHDNISPVWPASGLALAALWGLGLSRWPALFVGSLAVALLGHVPLLASLGISVGSTLEAILGVLLLRRLGFSAALERVQDVVALIAWVAMGCTLVSTLVGCTTLALVGALPWDGFFQAVWVWWGAGATGIVVVAPVLLLLSPWRPVERRPEAVVLAGCTLLVCLGLFTVALVGPFTWYVGPFFFFPLAAWAALRFGPREVALVTLLLTGFSLWGAMKGLRPLSQGADAQVHTLLLWQLGIGLDAATCLLLAAASTGRLEAMKRLELLAAAVRGVGEGVLISELTPEGPKMVFANEAFRALVGREEAELIGRPPRGLAGELDPDTRARLDTAIREAAPFRGQISLRHRDGLRISSEMHLSAVRSAEGAVTHMVSIHRDVTALQQLRARVVAAERVAAVSTLAAGVGHEIRNPLAYVELNLAGAERSLDQSRVQVAQALTHLHEAREGTERIRLIVQDLRTFSGQGGEDRKPLDLREVAAPAVRVLRHVLEGKTRLVEDYEPIPRVLASESRLGQVLLNLLVNAGQAIPEGAPAQHVVRIHTCAAPDGRAQVEVSDTGRGIPPEVLPHLFEPFFTTKSSEEGTGLGLSICQQIIQLHGGELLVRTEPGKGSTFTVLLPAVPQEAAREGPGGRAERAPASSTASAAHKGRILIVDDEPRLAWSMRMLLEPAYDVVTSSGGDEALALLSSGNHFDVVVCDLQMPGTTGMDLYARLRERKPELAQRLVFMSGGACTHAASQFIRTVPNRVLDKPVRPELLLATIRAALEPRASL
jgi:PAS domain S-box-containing protein